MTPRLLPCFRAAVLAPVAVLAFVQPARADTAGQAVPVGVILNGQVLAEPVLVMLAGGRVLVRRADIDGWGLDPQALPPGEPDGYVSAASIRGLRARLDAEGATLVVEAEADLFPRTAIEPAHRAVPVSPAVPAQFLDYDLTLGAWDGRARLSGLLDAGASGAWGSFGSTVLVDSAGGGLVRLDTAWRRDFPERRLRLVVGDAMGRGSPWSRPVHYGGVFLGTDFALDPQAVTFPLPVISGSALTPSTVELVSDASRRAMTVGPGPFDLALQPRLTGAGQVMMSVRDLAGQVRQVTRSFYASTGLLRPGLSEVAFEAGALRRGFGTRGFAYGPLFAALGLRHGVTGGLTLEGRIEASAATRMAGGGAALVIAPLGELSVAGAFSQGRAGEGALLRVQAQRITQHWSLTASCERADAGFRQVGEASRRGPGEAEGGRSELAVAGSVTLGRFGSMNAGYALLRRGIGGDESRFAIASAGVSANVAHGFLSLGMQHVARRERAMRGGRELGLFGALTLPFGGRGNASVTAEPGRFAAAWDKGLPDDAGIGWRALAGLDRGQARVEGAVSWRTGAGDLRVEAVRRGGRGGVQANARGALLRVDGATLATPRIDAAFTLVEVASASPVTVMVENRPVVRKARTGRRVIVTGLQPYAPNHIAIDPGEMAIDAALDTGEQVVAPGWRQAARVSFGTAARTAARLRLLDAAGQPLPAGGKASWPGGEGIVGHGGEVWIEDYAPAGELRVEGPDLACTAIIPTLSGEALLAAAAPTPCIASTINPPVALARETRP